MIVDLVIPVFNEEAQLAASISTLEQFFTQNCHFECRIIIADNGSTDGTPREAEKICNQGSDIRVVRLEEKGRGRALKKVWSESDANILSYMDLDLSTGLNAFPPLIAALAGGGYDLATGSRLLRGSQVTRGFKRELISRGYNLLVKALFRTSFSDAQCGFKAITRPAAQALFPLVEDSSWFFDTELMVLAEKLGYRIFDLPVRWVDDSDSRVKIFHTAIEDIKGLIRLKRNFAQGKYEPHKVALRDAGVASTLIRESGGPVP